MRNVGMEAPFFLTLTGQHSNRSSVPYKDREQWKFGKM